MLSRIYTTLFLMAIGLVTNAQVTTASLAGLITDAQGDPITGATITATHEPSGTRYSAATNIDGRYSIQGMRVGGPYTVKASYIGMQPVAYKDIMLQLGEIEELNIQMNPGSIELGEVVATGRASHFAAEKTGATTNISQSQIQAIPTVNRSISDLARLSPYANGMSFAGGDGRSTNFTIDGANFNNNFGLSETLPGGGNPISTDAIEEMQVAVAPFDVRQTNFIGGGVNAITKSGTNQFKGTAYIYYTNQDFRGNRIDGQDLGGRSDESKTIYGFTLGGPIIKNKLFFFANYEHEKEPFEVIKYRAREAGQAVDEMTSRTLIADMKRVSDHLANRYGYNAGSYNNFPGDNVNNKYLIRLDWNINDYHKLSLRFNHTKNSAWNAPNGNSSDTGYRLNGTNRVGPMSMAFANSMYSLDNKVTSWALDFNSRFTESLSNQLLFTFTDIQDIRGSNSSPFPFIDIMDGYSVAADGSRTPILEPYMSLGYELFTWNNGVKNKIYNLTDNVTWNLGNHRLMGGISFEHQFANNAYMRNGTGYYRYNSVDDFINGAAPESFALTYGWNGVSDPNAQVTFNQLGIYLQDEWNISKRFKLTYGIRLDELMFDNSDLATNKAIYALDFGGQHIDTGHWPDSRMQISPRIGFNWDIFGNRSLSLRGGTGIFTGRLPLVFFTNMPTNAGMVQNSVTFKTTYKNGIPVAAAPQLAQLAVGANGKIPTTVDEMIKFFDLPTQISDENHVAGSKISGVASDFKMPQIWKSSIALDWQVPVKFPFTLTGEFIYTKNINAVTLDNINIIDPSQWPGGEAANRFAGPDNRLKYPATYTYVGGGKNAVVLDNTSKGHGYTFNLTANMRPIDNLSLMAAYTHTESKEVSGMPGNDPVSTWQGLITIDGPNFGTVQRSRYVIPDRLIASATWTIPFTYKGLARNTNISLFYTGYSSTGNSFCYTNDMNGDGINNDLIYIPAKGENLNFKTPEDAIAFEAFINQDSYLSSHRGQYAEAYAARAPWVHTFDLRLMEEFEFNIGKTKHAIQLSFDIMNIGNLLNSSWGVQKIATQASNGCRVLKYEGVDAANKPIYSMMKNANGEYYSTTYDYNYNNSQCWQMQVGIKYLFK
ncbi:MAG: TonB-dependent receptor [Pseudoflavonifractor sp.]|nr:TonB-dependent receptor [Alloprevotella sp.]MCM1115959.1 TonB-dependent receptor [Pseudoflavonifractor sp.]